MEMAFNLGVISGALDDAKIEPAGVDFSGRSLKLDNSSEAQSIVEAIQRCASLQSLDLTGNTLGVGAAEAIAQALETRPELQRARCSDMFTGRMKTEIPPALAALGNGMIKAGARLTVLELSDNAFGPIGVEGLATLLQSQVCSRLEELRLNNNGLGITGGKLLAKALLGTGLADATTPRLKVFIAGRNRLENEGAKALAEVFQVMGSLEEIAMPQNGIYHVGISALCEALKHNPSLRTLNLNDNTIGPKGAEALAKVLPRLKTLRAINFGDCLLKSKGALALAKAFRENDLLLEVLDLSHNEIGSDACAELVEAISRLPDSLERLDRVVLAGNRLGGAASKKCMREKLGDCATLSDGEDSDEDNTDESEEESDENTESASNDDHNDTLVETDLHTDRLAQVLNTTESEEESDENTESASNDDHNDTLVETDLHTDRLAQVLNTTVVVEEVLSDAARFLKEPTLDNLKKLGNAPANAIGQHLQSIPDAMRAIEAYVEAVMLVSGLSLGSEGSHVTDVARELYAFTVQRAGEKHAARWLLANTLLVHLGFMKSESKQFQIRWSLDGCYSVLSDVLAEPFFPESLRDTIRFFAKSKHLKGDDPRIAMYPNLYK